MTHRITSTQPEPVKMRIYGAKKVIPLDSANQPEVIPTKINGSKVLPTIRVRMKDSNDDRVLIINQRDFDPDRFVRLD